jgi:L-ascorbate metabolism protein UlaG (beta-lactamase superfamily)
MKIDLLDILLRNNSISRMEFNELIHQMGTDPVGFILNEKNPGVAKKKNIIKSIYQIIYPYSTSNFVVNKPELDHINMTFLGVAAGGYAVSQGSRTGGFVLHTGNTRIHVDPGISAVRDCWDYTACSGENLDPILTDALLVTHNHIDHAGGIEEYAEFWLPFSGLLKKTIIANKTLIKGNPDFDQGPRLDKYKKANFDVRSLDPGERIDLEDITVRATRAIHIEAFDPITRKGGGNCLGFVVETPFGSIGITGDTEYYQSMADEFSDVDYLVAYMVQERSRAEAEPERYSTGDIMKGKEAPHAQFLGEIGVEMLLKEINPKVCMLTHYGDQLATFMNKKLVYRGIPEAVAKRIGNNTGVRTIACLNGMKIRLKYKINVELNEKYFLC